MLTSPWDLDYSTPRRQRKARFMRPAASAGSRVGEGRLANRRGGKTRGMKAGGKQGDRPVNVSRLVKGKS